MERDVVATDRKIKNPIPAPRIVGELLSIRRREFKYEYYLITIWKLIETEYRKHY